MSDQQLEATEAAAILQAITDANPDGVLPVMELEPPRPPVLMRLDVQECGVISATYRDVVASSLPSPSIFRFETLDGRIFLMDMTGRDFVLNPQVA